MTTQPPDRHEKQQGPFKLEELSFAFDYAQKLLDRRQTNTSFYLTVNTGILALIGLILKDSHLPEPWLLASILVLIVAGLVACWIWRSLIRQYEILIGWWYSRLREMEEKLPDSSRLITLEYQELYQGEKKIGMTPRELILNSVFIALYAIFALGIVWYLLS